MNPTKHYKTIRNGSLAAVASVILMSLLLLDDASSFSTTFPISKYSTLSRRSVAPLNRLHAEIPSWKDLEAATQCGSHDQPTAVNGASYASHPDFLGNGKPILYRERHGWCPYSERVWLALEAKGIDYDTVYIDNIYGRPSWYGGNTPQMRWEDGRTQAESMDLVREIDKRYDGEVTLYPSDIQNEVINKSERAFRNIFPKRSRPSSRAAFLFRFDGSPLWKNEFEKTLRETDALLGETEGPFFCGDWFTAADVCWAPFLERYAGQLPCLHEGLDPRSSKDYPHLAKWYIAMETTIPAYGCRVKGDPSSWRKVLTMAGFGNAGNVPAVISERMDELTVQEQQPLSDAERQQQQSLWDRYASRRPYVAVSPNQEAAAVLIRNRENIKKDVAKNYGGDTELVQSDESLGKAMRSLAVLLCDENTFADEVTQACEDECGADLRQLASFLDERMCVPRDMGALSAACFKRF